MKIAVVGLGYVGLPLAAALSVKTKYDILGFDISRKKIEKINNGECPINDDQCEKDMRLKSLHVSSDPDSLAGSDVFILCVPTPVLDDFTPDLQPLISATKTICGYLTKGNVVVVESTVNPGVCEEVVIPTIEKNSDLKVIDDFDVVHCPERINPGDEKWNVYNIPRNIGGSTVESAEKIAAIYREFISGEINVMPDLKTAEATKIIENTFRDINIAFVNELARSFDVLGIDLKVVIDGAANKPFAFLPHYPGCGVGGHCIPVDPYYLIQRAMKSGFDHKFLKLAREINNSMPGYTVDLLTNALNEIEKPMKGTRVALLGLSYKANVGDLRESPALKIKAILKEKKADLVCYDPFFPDLSDVAGLEEALERSEAIVLAADHKAFKHISPEILKKCDVNIVIDGKNFLNKESFQQAGIFYKGIGI